MAGRSKILLAVWLAGAGCIGSIDGSGRGGSSGPSPGQGQMPGPSGPGGPAPVNPGPGGGPDPSAPIPPPLGPGGGQMAPLDLEAAGPQPLRRLDRREYNNTVRDLLGDTTRPADRFPSDRDTDFLFRHTGPVTSQDYATIQEAAEGLAAAAVKNIATLAPCGPDEACARTFAQSFGLRAYRRPLAPREVDSLVQLYKETRAGMPGVGMIDHAGGIQAMIEGLLQSPAFLYHWEAGPAAPVMEGKVVRLGPYENASQLSYFLWGSMPDNALFEAAAANKLGTQQELEAQARRMLADPRARDTVAAFVEEWLALDTVAERAKDPKLYPEWKDELKAAMLAEAHAFAGGVVFDGDGHLNTLLTASYSFVNQPLASVYGLTGVAGMNMQRSSLDPAQRAGLLTQAAFLTMTGAADGSNPVRRGHKIYTRLLCGELPDPPPDVPPPKAASMGGTTRERFAEHGQNACARGCHAVLDPLGFAFENYDGIGRWRTMDNGGAVDASGAMELEGKQIMFSDARQLMKLLADSETARRCFAVQWTRFALKRGVTEGDRASLEAIAGAFRTGGYSVRDLMIGITGARSFRYRAPADGEMLK
jgi:hypothetical protein